MKIEKITKLVEASTSIPKFKTILSPERMFLCKFAGKDSLSVSSKTRRPDIKDILQPVFIHQFD